MNTHTTHRRISLPMIVIILGEVAVAQIAGSTIAAASRNGPADALRGFKQELMAETTKYLILASIDIVLKTNSAGKWLKQSWDLMLWK